MSLGESGNGTLEATARRVARMFDIRPTKVRGVDLTGLRVRCHLCTWRQVFLPSSRLDESPDQLAEVAAAAHMRGHVAVK